MPVALETLLSDLTAEDRTAVAARTAELIAEEMTLRDLRKAVALTQEQLAAQLHITQDGVSRLERRTDLRISTLRAVVKAMGGEMHLVVSFPGRPPVRISGLDRLDARDGSTSTSD